MAWVKLDDQYRTNLKALGVGAEGVALDIAGMCFCSANLTDGFIPDNAVSSLYPLRNLKRTVDALVAAKRWERDEERGGYWVHDYLEYNPPRAKVVAERERQRKKKAAQRRGDDGQYRGESPGDNRRDNRGESPPSRPVPSPSVVSSSSSTYLLATGSEEEDWALIEAKRRLATRAPHLPVVNDPAKWVNDVAAKIRTDETPPPLHVVREPCRAPGCRNGIVELDDGFAKPCPSCNPRARTA